MPSLHSAHGSRLRSWSVKIAIAHLCLALPLGAQRAPAPEFVRQTLVMTPVRVDGEERVMLRRAADAQDALEDVLRDSTDRRQLGIVGPDSIARMLRNGGLSRPDQARETEQLWVGRLSRGDELLLSQLVARGDSLEMRGSLVLIRDPRVREPLPVVRGSSPTMVGRQFARAVLRARSQSAPLRRCENHANAGDLPAAMREGERALRAYPNGLLLRSCLLRLLVATSVSRDSVLAVADFIIARDTANIIAQAIRARTLAAEQRTGPAIAAWQRVVALRPDSLDLGLEASDALLRLSRAREALRVVDTVAVLHATEPRLRRQRFRALHDLARWPEAAALGDTLEQVDGIFANEPVFITRYVEALKQRGDTLRALAKSARAVADHPGDGRLYVQYVELISGESRVALARGLAKFPSLASLRVLAAQQARASGDVVGERTALSAAVAVDGSQGPVYLRLAELWFRDGQTDSAVSVLARAPRVGDDVMLLRTYLVGKGLEMLRLSVDSLPDSYAAPMALLALADSVDSREDSRRLVVAASLQRARAHLVVGAAAQRCEPIQAAGLRLAVADDAIRRGVGEGQSAAELLEAHEGLRTAVGEAQRVLCRDAASDARADHRFVEGRVRD